jgi:hypothetical protein
MDSLCPTWSRKLAVKETNIRKTNMGLTIHYKLSVKRGTQIAWIKNLLRRTQRLARKNGCAHVGKVLHYESSI